MSYQAPGTWYNPQFGTPAYPGYQQPIYTQNTASGWGSQTPMPNPMQQQAFPSNTTSPQQAILPGRIVGSESDIRPNEVPSNGDPSVFPLGDFSEILVKSVNTDGMISTVTYRPVPQELGAKGSDQTSEPPAYFTELASKVEEISAYLPQLREQLEELKKAVI